MTGCEHFDGYECKLYHSAGYCTYLCKENFDSCNKNCFRIIEKLWCNTKMFCKKKCQIQWEFDR